jgi:hypothetical protein
MDPLQAPQKVCSIIAARFEIIVFIRPWIGPALAPFSSLPAVSVHILASRANHLLHNFGVSLEVAKSQLSSFSALCRRRVSQTRNDDVSTVERVQHYFLEVISPLAAN